MLISVVVPVYKVERYLGLCVESLLAQTCPEWEAILVDDGSPDSCGALCDEWACRDARIRAVHRPNGGLSAARNTGIAAAKGDYILLLDSDDMLVPAALQTLADAAARSSADLILFDYSRITDEGEPVANEEHRSVPAGEYTPETALQLFELNRIPLVTAWSKLYKRTMFDALTFPEGKLNEDEFTAHRFLAAGQHYLALADKLYLYRDRPGSIIRTLTPYAAANVLFAFADRIELLRQKNITAAAQRQQANFWNIFKYRYPQLALGTPQEKARAAEIRALYCGLYPALKRDNTFGADNTKALLLRYLPHLYALIYRIVFKNQT